MRKPYLLFKKEKIDDQVPTVIPAWLQDRIAAIKKEQQAQLYVVSEYRIGGVTFYNVSSPISSCILCELYDVKGIPAKLALDAQTEIKQVRVIWPVNRQIAKLTSA
ncbi:hypothetical protein [Niabella hibiscisoli]|uniref:hypothetical protein n=1 Tax=Niabella hibiscisoli TaxID=1825928 RepID=UPI001F103141|nr:hypothetical protein [Niabella hibiscisoli]MCH5717545.1 hypothetical protein [Niabella hibiscisoli]